MTIAHFLNIVLSFLENLKGNDVLEEGKSRFGEVAPL